MAIDVLGHIAVTLRVTGMFGAPSSEPIGIPPHLSLPLLQFPTLMLVHEIETR